IRQSIAGGPGRQGRPRAGSGSAYFSALIADIHPAIFCPVLFPNILINFDGLGALRIEPIAAVFPRARNPIVITSLDVEVIPLIALGFLKFLPAIFYRPSRL